MRISLNFSRGIGLILLLLGFAALIAATVYSSSIPALVGLGLVFWGIIITYIQPEEYIKKTIVESISTTLLTTLDETLKTLDYTGKAVYLPPKYLNDPESIKAYVPKQETRILPSPDTTQKLEKQSAPKNAQGILITPPATELARLLETELGTSFLRMNLKDLQQRLPRTLIENLEVATNCEILTFTEKTVELSTGNVQINQNMIIVRFTTTALKDICKKATQLPMIFSNIGCPLSSVFAIAFARTTGKPVCITTQKVSEDGEENETEYTIVEDLKA
jgi:hypothetical protein